MWQRQFSSENRQGIEGKAREQGDGFCMSQEHIFPTPIGAITTVQAQPSNLAIITDILEEAASWIASLLRLDCMAANAALCAYYERYGFMCRGIIGQKWQASLYEKSVS
jgi:hypothetical protein